MMAKKYGFVESEKYAVYADSDLEKTGQDNHDSDFEDEHSNRHESFYSSSSRESSGSFKPMLRKHSISGKRCRKRELYRPPSRRNIRYLCFAIFTTLVLFILSLWRASYVSSKQLELGLVEKQSTTPAPWEDFPFLKRYFGGVRNLGSRSENPPEYPSDLEPIEQTKNDTRNITDKLTYKIPHLALYDPYEGNVLLADGSAMPPRQECYLDKEAKIAIPKVHYYNGVPKGLPDPVIGSYGVLGMRNDVCFDRYGRLSAYGFGYSVQRGGTGSGLEGEREGSDQMWLEKDAVPEVDYRKVKWSAAQKECSRKNQHRLKKLEDNAVRPDDIFTEMGLNEKEKRHNVHSLRKRSNESALVNETEKYHTTSNIPFSGQLNRSAIVIRTWWNRQYSVEDIIYLRSMIAELALLSGGEYTIHFLVHVKDDGVPIWADKRIYDRVLENSLPPEFQNMGVLWSERQMGLIYGGLQETFVRDLPVHGVYRGHYMALQYFSHQHPEYDFVWNWEMDVRNTGHWYHLFDKVQKWTREQPRKGLWERNSRFYVPSVHGTWEDFKQMVRVQTELGTQSPNNLWSGLKGVGREIPGLPQEKGDRVVWGPDAPKDVLEAQEDCEPPTNIEKDNYEWGVGEEADFVTFSPLFDPDGTTWFYTEDVTGYNTTAGLPPRRATIGTSTRLSKRLLQTMHRETVLAKHHMFTEMWPASIALHHGYKAVYAPHPIYIDRRWPTSYLENVMNAGRNGASGGARTSVYGGREHNFKGQTWFYDAGFSPNLWRRWLGYKVDNDGGEQEEKAGEGRMCLPAILLHPVKDVQLVAEGTLVTEEQDVQYNETLADAELDWEPVD